MRSFSIIAGVLLALSLPGCAGGDNLLTEPTGQQSGDTEQNTHPAGTSRFTDSPPAFHFKSGDLPLGDFNYEDIKDNLFNPCEEISAEEFAAIGFTTDGRNRRDAYREVNGCVVERVEITSEDYLVTGGLANLAEVESQGLLLDRDVSAQLPGAYVYRSPLGDESICLASVDTKRGQLGSMVSTLDDQVSMSHLCNEAVSVLEALYRGK